MTSRHAEAREPGSLGSSLSEGLSAAARWLRWLPARLLHPLRRRRARRLLSDKRSSAPVLFICHGNICRSPYAEVVFRRMARDRVEASSAGLMGPDRPSPDTAVKVAGERGVDLRGHRSRLVTGGALRAAGTVVVMDPYQADELRRRHGYSGALVLGDLDPDPIRRRPIRDPIFQTDEVFRVVYDRIDRCVANMLVAMGLLSEDVSPGTGGVAGESELCGPAEAETDEVSPSDLPPSQASIMIGERSAGAI